MAMVTNLYSAFSIGIFKCALQTIDCSMGETGHHNMLFYGVPQGSLLGPRLYSINGICMYVKQKYRGWTVSMETVRTAES